MSGVVPVSASVTSAPRFEAPKATAYPSPCPIVEKLGSAGLFQQISKNASALKTASANYDSKEVTIGPVPQALAVTQAEKDRNLKLIWPRIAKAMEWEITDPSAEKIKEVLHKYASQLTAIVVLDLSNLGLTQLPDEIANLELPRLLCLRLNGNQLVHLPEKMGLKWVRLETVHLENNELQTLPDDFGDAWTSLEDVHLEHNQLKDLPPHFGRHWINLAMIILSHNRLKELSPSLGSAWKKVICVILDHNLIETLPEEWGKGWEKVGRVQLAHNLIKALPDDFAKWWENVCHIYLHHNKLSALPPEVKVRLQSKLYCLHYNWLVLEGNSIT